MLMKPEKDRKQANIQGIHCIIKTTTGNRRWGLGEFLFVVDFPEKEFLSFFFGHFQSCTFWPVSCTSIYHLSASPKVSPSAQLILFLTYSFSVFHLPYLRSLLNIQNTSPQQPQHIMYIALHTLRPKISFVILLSC